MLFETRRALKEIYRAPKRSKGREALSAPALIGILLPSPLLPLSWDRSPLLLRTCMGHSAILVTTLLGLAVCISFAVRLISIIQSQSLYRMSVTSSCLKLDRKDTSQGHLFIILDQLANRIIVTNNTIIIIVIFNVIFLSTFVSTLPSSSY